MWQTRPQGRRFSDQLTCSSCTHVHRSETWFAPLAWASEDDCLNCGAPPHSGTLQMAHLDDNEEALSDQPCHRCEHSALRVQKLHRKLIAVHPEGDPTEGAQMALTLGRNLLALKLATFAIAMDPDNIAARLIRLQTMERMSFITPALDQAWVWVDNGAPAAIWPVIASLEAAQGNMEGAIFALERGLQYEPKNTSMWADYGELLAHNDNRPLAIQAACQALPDENHRGRCLDIIALMADRYYQEELMADAVKALNLTGEYQNQHIEIAWLRARIAHITNQPMESFRWLEAVLALEPGHGEANAAMASWRTSPAKKRRSWLVS